MLFEREAQGFDGQLHKYKRLGNDFVDVVGLERGTRLKIADAADQDDRRVGILGFRPQLLAEVRIRGHIRRQVNNHQIGLIIVEVAKDHRGVGKALELETHGTQRTANHRARNHVVVGHDRRQLQERLVNVRCIAGAQLHEHIHGGADCTLGGLRGALRHLIQHLEEGEQRRNQPMQSRLGRGARQREHGFYLAPQLAENHRPARVSLRLPEHIQMLGHPRECLADRHACTLRFGCLENFGGSEISGIILSAPARKLVPELCHEVVQWGGRFGEEPRGSRLHRLFH